MWMGQNLLLPSISISNGNQLRWASYLFQGIIFWGCWFWPSKSEANPNQIWSNFPILQDQSPDLVAPPMAAHHAAALDRVWWLERCAATPGRWTGEKWPPMLIYIYIYLSIYISIYIYSCGPKLRMTTWKPPGVNKSPRSSRRSAWEDAKHCIYGAKWPKTELRMRCKQKANICRINVGWTIVERVQ